MCLVLYTDYHFINMSTINSNTSRLGKNSFSILCIKTFFIDVKLSSEQLQV